MIRYGIQIGEIGFKSINHRYSRFINLGDLNQQLESWVEAGYAKQSDGKFEVDLGRAGYTKLLGEGGVDKPLRVIVNQCSEKAAEKISHAGGEIVLPSKGKED